MIVSRIESDPAELSGTSHPARIGTGASARAPLVITGEELFCALDRFTEAVLVG